MLTIITGTTRKIQAGKSLKSFFESRPDLEGYLYIGYPIIGSINGGYPIDSLWVSKQYGLVIFNLVENKDISKYEEFQDDSANILDSRIRGNKELLKKRHLCVNINVITYAPIVHDIHDYDAEYPLCNDTNIAQVIENLEKWEYSDKYTKVVSVIQTISTLRTNKNKRTILKKDSKGSKLADLEDTIANLDKNQSKAVIETVEGVQRIRGLAGSGKTIIIALKAAYLHAQHPDWKIAVTFNTRSLKGQFKKLITMSYFDQTKEEPNWDNLQIIHAWGAPGGGEKNGIYYSFCENNNVPYYNLSEAREKFNSSDLFSDVCNEALIQAKFIEQKYDVILVDEAQDFSPSFLKICYEILTKPKMLIYAYDELQNLGVSSLPSPEMIFGNDMNGIPLVHIKSKDDIVLQKCYRNSRPTLVTAHALGFGIYRKPQEIDESGLVQIFENKDLWLDIGYENNLGKIIDGKKVVLHRTEESSPKFLEVESNPDELIQFHSFKTKQEQDQWVTDEIIKNIKEDELMPDDIIVINTNPKTTKKAVTEIRANLFDKKIRTHTAGVDTSPDVFFDLDHESIAFTGIYRAKGNEAGMVYVINAQECYKSYSELATIRNRLFTAITRSKAWVRIVGFGDNMTKLCNEYSMVKENDFMLNFVYPTIEQRAHMNVVNRDKSPRDLKEIKSGVESLDNFLEKLDAGKIMAEDLKGERLEKIKSLFLNK